MFELF